MNAAAIRAVRARFGDLAEPVMALREAGRVVAPFGDGFRVDEDVLDADELRALADRLQARQAKKSRETAVLKRLPGEDAGTTGNRATGPGSILANATHEPRSPAGPLSGPSPPFAVEGKTGERGTKRTCAKCGGLRSRESKALCAICYAQAGRGSYPVKPTADVRDKFAKSKARGGGEARPAPEGSIFSRASITQTPSPGQTEGAAGCELESGGAATGANPSTVEPHKPADQQKADDGGAWMQAGVAPGPRDPIPAVTPTCRCGRPRTHGGRCWVRWGYDEPQERAIGKPREKVCESCGGPRSYWSAGKCRKCYAAVPHTTQDQRIVALKANFAALEAELAAFKATVRDAVRELLERIEGAGEGR